MNETGKNALFASAALLVVPSVWPEPFGLVGLEAGAHGVPAVAFETGGVGEWLRDGTNGLMAGRRPAVEPLARAIAAALADPDPVLIFEHVLLYNLEGQLDARVTGVDLDRAAVRRPGADVSLITYGGSLPKTLAAAEQLAADGIDAEVVDIRSLRPLDAGTVLGSVRKTRRAVVVDEGWRSGSLAAEIVARIAEDAFYELDAPPARVYDALVRELPERKRRQQHRLKKTHILPLPRVRPTRNRIRTCS